MNNSKCSKCWNHCTFYFINTVSYTHLRAHETREDLVCRLLLEKKQHFTKPINRFTEASLVKELEKLGIGRPSTYASILKKIQDKEYVNKVKGAMIPTFTAFAIVQFLEQYFDDLVNLKYTSNMEDDLDLSLIHI